MESGNSKKYVWMSGTLALLSIAFGSFAFGLESLSAVKHPNGQVASITVSGDGEVTAKPDIATVAFTVRESAKTVPEAQKAAEAKIASALKELGALKVEEKDIKTTSYTVNPKYETQQTYCVTYQCPTGKTTLTGYEVVQSVTVKIRKVDQAGEVLGLIGKVNITEMNGPDFTVDDLDKAQADAKELAIAKAKAKAEATAKSLGVELGSITSFSDDQGGYYATMYRADVMAAGMTKSESVTLPQGESVIKSRVTITYTLK
ncbi:MAG: SIMPL domain-containing protein [Candidatus Pacebacteria bacterium]|nr:SIMPL domain-containing protein [Candidatus Paceibacterota bacterium]